MPILAFDTAQQACSAAISHDGELLTGCRRLIQRGHAEQLLPMIESVRQQAGVGFEDLELIAVTVGPGTFTGVRVGLAAARALALVHDLPILGVGTLELLAQGALLERPAATAAECGGGIIAAIDARRGELYSQAFDNTGQALTEAAVGPADPALAPAGAAPGLLVGTGARLLQAVLPDWQLLDGGAQPDVGVLALAAAAHWRHRASRRPPAPLYLRAPDARLPAEAAPAPPASAS
ncbi:MAG: tRNA (adenosine(37)-N6)-threonylcarbamoyltransferase complex dimerization subunit type 1 TsaB [Alphaproteobacteria bacterium]|jgi:tRNA threonylcarbamoyladenosine biosynthesis protein TsaB|nr:tRNA (adenosine(37)-N6)-threonylcarbamoyltransferase complex dimerization subunit type 1 TsaB [Alphaproteobacteria bacterium]